MKKLASLKAPLTALAVFALLWASPAAAQQWDRDEWLLSPVDDATFESFLDFFAYDAGLPFEMEVRSTTRQEGVQVQQLSFQSTAGIRVTATLFRPQADPAAKLPAVIALHGGVPEGKRMVSHFGPIVARAGWMYMAIDLLHFGDRDTGLFETFMNREKADRLYNVPSQYLQWVTQSVKDVGRSYDFLVGAHSADPARVVLLGVSRGGQLSLILGGADARLAGVAALIAGHFDAIETSHRAPACPANYIGRIAPRPLLTINGTSDPDYDRQLSVEPLHALAGDPHEAHWLDTGHSVPLEESMALLVDWLGRVPPLRR